MPRYKCGFLFYSCCLSMASDMRGYWSRINLNSRRLILIFDNKYNNNKQPWFPRYSNRPKHKFKLRLPLYEFDAFTRYKGQVTTEGSNYWEHSWKWKDFILTMWLLEIVYTSGRTIRQSMIFSIPRDWNVQCTQINETTSKRYILVRW